jgi:hypothetical protein
LPDADFERARRRSGYAERCRPATARWIFANALSHWLALAKESARSSTNYLMQWQDKLYRIIERRDHERPRTVFSG